MPRIRITTGPVSLVARLRDTPTAAAILAVLPCASQAHTWGEEVYFRVPIETTLEADARDVVQPGELAFWVEGNSIAIGFGPTPMSREQEIRLATRTNIWADSEDDVRQLAVVGDGDPVRVELLEEGDT